MGARLTKAAGWCKAVLLGGSIVFAGHSPADPQRGRQDLRDCVGAARDARAVAACEKSQQAVLRDRIKRWTKALRAQLDPKQQSLLDRNVRAWQAFYDSELAMLDLTLKQRADGLGAALHPGAITRLLEERERQLREHLHNATYGRQGGKP
ncbi:MAG: hypothetical protein KDJ27_06640 [Gammaproteobacteria bacterium]|nr:hypothetical protein [Gammaproteobacteria bacterium]MCB1923416.1 hypothetical protein [Gammaproteobacteria bacterium]